MIFELTTTDVVGRDTTSYATEMSKMIPNLQRFHLIISTSQKAFDLMKTTAVITALDKQGIQLVYVNIIKETDKNTTSTIRIHKTSEILKL